MSHGVLRALLEAQLDGDDKFKSAVAVKCAGLLTVAHIQDNA